MGWRPKFSWQLFIISLEMVLKIFIIILVNGNWSERSRVRLIGQASTAYSSTGTHVDLINCITTLSDAILPILPKTALKKRTSWHYQNNMKKCVKPVTKTPKYRTLSTHCSPEPSDSNIGEQLKWHRVPILVQTLFVTLIAKSKHWFTGRHQNLQWVNWRANNNMSSAYITIHALRKLYIHPICLLWTWLIKSSI